MRNHSVGNNLLIVGAGVYSVVAKEIAQSMNCFDRIDFVDDYKEKAWDSTPVIGTSDSLKALSETYGNVIVAIGNCDVRLKMLQKIESETSLKMVTIVSPAAYVSPSARIAKGTIIEPFAAIHTGAAVSKGCIISTGAVVNHGSVCGSGVHVDCNAIVASNTLVPDKTKVFYGTVFKGEIPTQDDFAV